MAVTAQPKVSHDIKLHYIYNFYYIYITGVTQQLGETIVAMSTLVSQQ